MADYCCYQMREQLTKSCKDHPRKEDCPDILVTETAFGEIALPIRDGGRSSIVILFCPWCGSSLDPNLKPKTYGNTAVGVPRCNPMGKIEALSYCIRENQKRGAEPGEMAEDILGHVCDLLVYYAKQMSMTPSGALKHYGKNSDGTIFPVNFSKFSKRTGESKFVKDAHED